MRRRIYLVSAAAGVSSLFLAVALAPAAFSAGKKPKAKSAIVKCHTAVGIAVPAGQTGVVVPAPGGKEYGSAHCNKGLGAGVQADSFTVVDSGDSVGTWVRYFATGTLRGSMDLSPGEGNLSNPSEVDYTGALTVTGGTGAYKGYKGTGTSTCVSLDGIHTTCTERFKLTLPAAPAKPKH